MASTHGGFPPPLTCGGDPAAPGNVAQDLEAMSPAQFIAVELAFSWRVAEPSPRPSASGALPVHPQEKFATDGFSPPWDGA